MTRPISLLAPPLLLALAALTACGGGGSSTVATDPGTKQRPIRLDV